MKSLVKYAYGVTLIFVVGFLFATSALLVKGFTTTTMVIQPQVAADLLSARVTAEKSPSVNWYIFTGGPGTGKTSVLTELGARGYATVAEAATTVIAQGLSDGEKTPWSEPWFEVAVAATMAQRQDAVAKTRAPIVFFDRGPVDPISYILWYKKPVNQQAIAELNCLLLNDKFNSVVFVFQDLGGCENTVIRHETVAEMLQIEDRLIRDYESLGFNIVKVPSASIKDRADFILAHCGVSLVSQKPAGAFEGPAAAQV